MTEKDLAREIMLTELASERAKQVLEYSQRCAARERELDTITRERDSLLERIRELETQKECAQSAPTCHD